MTVMVHLDRGSSPCDALIAARLAQLVVSHLRCGVSLAVLRELRKVLTGDLGLSGETLVHEDVVLAACTAIKAHFALVLRAGV